MDFITSLGNIARECNLTQSEQDAFEHFSKPCKFGELNDHNISAIELARAFFKIGKDHLEQYEEVMSMELSMDTEFDGERKNS